jgi:hypothetical protein
MMKKILLVTGFIFSFIYFSNFVFAAATVGLTASYSSGPFSGQAVPLTSNNAGTAYDQGVEPNSNITLTATYNGDVQKACGQDGEHLYRTMVHYIDGNADHNSESNLEAFASGLASTDTFSYTFNSGPATQNNTYRAVFYCRTISDPNQILHNTSLIRWNSLYFVGKTAGAPCSFIGLDWNKKTASTGETVTMTATSGDHWCQGLSFDYEIWRGAKDLGNRVDVDIRGTFSTDKALPLVVQKTWQPSTAQNYAFRIKLADGSCARDPKGNCLWSPYLTVTGNDVVCKLTSSWDKNSGKIGEKITGKINGTETCAGRNTTFQVANANSGAVKDQKTVAMPSSGTPSLPIDFTPTENGSYIINAKLEGSNTITPSGILVIGGSSGASVEFPNPLENDSVLGLIGSVMSWMIIISIPITILMIIFAGFLLLTNQGEPKRIDQAKKILTWTVIGFAIILIGKGFITLILSILDMAK